MGRNFVPVSGSWRFRTEVGDLKVRVAETSRPHPAVTVSSNNHQIRRRRQATMPNRQPSRLHAFSPSSESYGIGCCLTALEPRPPQSPEVGRAQPIDETPRSHGVSNHLVLWLGTGFDSRRRLRRVTSRCPPSPGLEPVGTRPCRSPLASATASMAFQAAATLSPPSPGAL